MVFAMVGIRALQKRLVKLEDAGKPRPSPFTNLFGSFDAEVEHEVLPGIESGAAGYGGGRSCPPSMGSERDMGAGTCSLTVSAGRSIALRGGASPTASRVKATDPLRHNIGVSSGERSLLLGLTLPVPWAPDVGCCYDVWVISRR